MNNREREESLTLEILAAIEARSDVTQRHLARSTGIALGLANSYLKRCVRKGLVKIQQAPANRYLYYLTPKGFAEKSRLTAEYLSYSFRFYRMAGESLTRLFTELQEHGVERVGLYGISDLAEIAAIRALDQGMHIMAVCDRVDGRKSFLEISVVKQLDEAPDVQAWVLTDLADTRRNWQRLSVEAGKVQVFVPDILGLETK